MGKTLQMKLMLVFIVLTVSLMTIIGSVILVSLTNFNSEAFTDEMDRVFTDSFKKSLSRTADEDEAVQMLFSMLEAYSGSLGINSYRNFYILDGETGEYLIGDNESLGRSLEKTPNLIAALNGKNSKDISVVFGYMDYAVPISGEYSGTSYIIYVKDSIEELKESTWMIFAIIIQALFAGLIISVFLSFLLSKTITKPIESLTSGAKKMASGNLSMRIDVNSDDEIGNLTEAFNNMADDLEKTLLDIDAERNKLNTIFAYLADGVVAFNGIGEVIHINKSAYIMLNSRGFKDFDGFLKASGITELAFSDVSGLTFGEFMPADALVKDKELKLYFASLSLENEDDRGVVLVIHDVTEEKRLDDLRKEFVANVSHELRTPLTAIKGYTETVIESGDNITAEQRNRFLNVVLKETDRMVLIVHDLLLLSRLENNKMDWHFSENSLKSIIQSVYDALLIQAKNAGIALAVKPLNDPLEVMCDKDKVAQVIVNIVSNAIKYTPSGGSVSVSAYKNEAGVIVKVIDSGIGISQEDINHVFDRFYRVDKARSREKGGTGLGLSIAKEIVESHGGTITIKSALDVGTEVTLFLPRNVSGKVSAAE